jgi:hypothetical protein
MLKAAIVLELALGKYDKAELLLLSWYSTPPSDCSRRAVPRRPLRLKSRLELNASVRRDCEVRYCITGHCGFLLGLSAAGDLICGFFGNGSQGPHQCDT